MKVWSTFIRDGYTFFVTNLRTKKEYKLNIREFIYYSPDFNDIVNSFPDYVHKEIWNKSDFKRRAK